MGRTIFLLLLGLMIVQVVRCDTTHNEEEEEEEDDGVVEDEVEEVVVTPREKPHYKRPSVKGNTFFMEPFNTKEEAMKRWVQSEAKKDGVEDEIAKYDGKWSIEEPAENPLVGDLGLILSSKAKHHAISAKLDRPFEFKDKPLVAQYEVRFQNGIDCGGAYIKLLSKQDKMDLKLFHDKTPYTIMFGPDKCGLDHKLHFIFRHKNPKTGEFEEKHAKKPSAKMDSYYADKKTHLYTLVLNPDNTFEFFVDNSIVNQGNLLEDFSPPVNPPKEIEDPNDKKPKDWDEREKIPDPDASKPDDWDESEPEMIPDPNAVKPDGWLDDEPLLVPDSTADKPEDWDDDMDGEWEAPLVDNPKCKEAPGCGEWKPENIKNPKYKGKWSAPMIDNPDYKGIWKPRVIPNPKFFEDLQPLKSLTPISAIGLELWSMSDGIMFDNFLITDDRSVAESYAEQTWVLKNVEERTSSSIGGFWNSIKSAADERPWLWAVYVVVLLLPIVLLSICLCPKSGPIKPEDLDAQRKKTDEPSPDDEDSKDEKESSDSVGPGGDNSVKSKTSKSDLNAEVIDNEEEDEEDDADVEDDDEDEEADDKKSSSPKKSPRRRRARKE